MKQKTRRQPPEINAGSMADIAFLLLVFFLVATTVVADKGILVRLPPWDYTGSPPPKVPERNLLSILVDADGNLMVEGKETDLGDLRGIAREFITNPHQRADLPSHPKKAVVSLLNDRGTPYRVYLGVYNELKAAYNQVWDEIAQQQYYKFYSELNDQQQRDIRNQYPQVISEAEPVDL